MKICIRQYRIVTDNFRGFEVQKKRWYFPFWLQIGEGTGNFDVNTNKTIKEAEELIEIDKTNSRPSKQPKSKVVKTFDCS